MSPGHVAGNAEALLRLAIWARTGVPTPMCADREQRAAEIESSAAELEDAPAALDAPTWRAEVRSALGRTIPAAEIPWMRVPEVWLHAIDLASGTAFADLPARLTDTLPDDVTATLSTRAPPARRSVSPRPTAPMTLPPCL
ncbi:maleylpyruvate isomerase N-terminal domain-containing protein [Streptomyces spongiae]|uniref:Mycothiol-dependent maleylpyruvate isomerase metal-binding domain-containing protein n=1 Tax=Streptomyces spongiae TaxID=565072 RepID=A0A5N8XNW9_9ACTN|nr:maleylpyruvate isomerase N-terminal domain-containing protein [Streptomyces spongiae]MPY61051.1 hypothetical protein [Streptomyces spongiae]